MPTAIKRRKLATDRKAPVSRVLTGFTTISKASAVTKVILEKNVVADGVGPPRTDLVANGKKRKFIEDEEGAEAQSSAEVKPVPAKPTPRTPRKPITSHTTPESFETPTKGARSLLDRFCISSKTPTKTSLSFNSSSSELIASTPEKTHQVPSNDLPTELLDLINLHAAFLTALSIHYAHNGTHSPADLRNLCPDVARAWGKRRVTLEDVRRILGLLNDNVPVGKDPKISRLTLSDYGHGKICIEIRTAGRHGRIAKPVNENLLNEIFERGLHSAWDRRDSELRVSDFIASLPMEAITICPSLLKMSPLLAKGQRRLEDLKSGIAVKRESAKPKVEISTSTGTRPTLLERLRAKQLQQSNLPAPPSKATVARKAALGRIEEVVAVVAILSTSTSVGQQRISFTLPTILGKLRDSFKTPMSKEEADTCVRLLVEDIAPDWVKLVKMGKVEALVVNRDERPKDLDIQERVRRAAE